MFVSMMAYPEFYQKHMQLFIAIAPAVFLGNMGAEPLRRAMKSEQANRLIREMGPEVLPEPAGFSPLLNNLHSVSESS